MLIIVEGPDNAGKSTLIQSLSDALGGETRIVQHDAYPQDSQPWHRYAQSLIDALEADDGHIVTLMERSWLSEFAYGRALDSYVRFDESAARGLERFALAMRTIVINCCPESVQTLDTEHHDAEVLGQVHDWYHRGALQESTALPVIRCEPGKGASDLLAIIDGEAEENYPETLLHELGDEPVYNGLVGNPFGADNLLINDKSGDRIDLPFFGLSGCSPWLSYRLDETHYSENDLCWYNVRDAEGVFKDAGPVHAWIRSRQIETGNTPRIFTLGAVASAWAESEQLPVTRTVKHPQAHKRFSEHVPYPLVEILESAGD